MWFQSVLMMMICLIGIVHGQSPDPAELLATAEASYPGCGLRCIGLALPGSACGPEDIECLCTNEALNKNITACVTETCTVTDQLTTKNVTMTMCGAPVRDRTAIPSIISLVTGSIAFVFFCLRCLSSILNLRTWGADDWMVTITMILAIPTIAISVVLDNLGLGKDIWVLPPQNITDILFYYYISEILYNVAIATIKISFLLLYIRLFPTKPYVYFVWATLILCIAYGTSFTVATIFQCTPVSMAWHQWDGVHEGFCTNFHLQVVVNASFNIALDILVFTLPLFKIRQLMISWEKKIAVMSMFLMGLFVTIVSIVRLANINEFANTHNVTWDYVPVGYLSLLELYVGIMCACIPAMRPLVQIVGTKVTSSIDKYKSKKSSTSESEVSGGQNFTPPPKHVKKDVDESILKETEIKSTWDTATQNV